EAVTATAAVSGIAASSTPTPTPTRTTRRSGPTTIVDRSFAALLFSVILAGGALGAMIGRNNAEVDAPSAVIAAAGAGGATPAPRGGALSGTPAAGAPAAGAPAPFPPGHVAHVHANTPTPTP